ncbi:hypothetical protein HDU76_006772 [Blyttiomyces sp. JEL0837]|nr:hypothetical protein HDU76_006772 [Blyttiomyces sp. JEL0837]
MESPIPNRSKQLTSRDHNNDLPPSRRSHGSQADFLAHNHGRRRSSVGTVTSITNKTNNTLTKEAPAKSLSFASPNSTGTIPNSTASQVIFQPFETDSAHYANLLNEYIANGGDENVVPASFAEHKMNKNNNGIGNSSTSISKSSIKNSQQQSRHSYAPSTMLIQSTAPKTRRDSNPLSQSHQRSSSTVFHPSHHMHHPLIYSTDLLDRHKSSASMGITRRESNMTVTKVNNMVNGVFSVDHLNKSTTTSPRSPRKSKQSRGKAPPMSRTSSSSGYFNPKPTGILKSSSSSTTSSRDVMTSLKLKPMLSESLDDYINKKEVVKASNSATSTASSFTSLDSTQSGSSSGMVGGAARRGRNQTAAVKGFDGRDVGSAMAVEMTGVGDDESKGMGYSIWVGLEKILKLKRK